LEGGRLARAENALLIPILQHERIAALLYLEVPQADLQSVAAVSGLVADAVVAGMGQPPRLSALENYLEQTPEDEIERRKLLLLLDRHEWNVSRVARALGKTRVTVYHRLAALGIERKRVLKFVRAARGKA